MNEVGTFVAEAWEGHVLPALSDYIAIPCKSPAFDAGWREHGHIDRAVALVEKWCRGRSIEGLRVEVLRLEGRTPLILMEVPGATEDTVLLYGHIDKQPETTGWEADLGPWKPVRRGDRLYGRGSADDGYAKFAAITAIEALQRLRIPHARCLILIEACEESGSNDLPAYFNVLRARIGQPSLIICLDSACGNYEQLWGVTSLRGVVNAELRVDVLREGVHSGASGTVPSSFRILRSLLSRLEDEDTGNILPPELHTQIPAHRLAEAHDVARTLGSRMSEDLRLVPGMQLALADPVELVLAGTWRPALSVIGAGGLPSVNDAGNVLRPWSSLKLSLRLPPTIDAEAIVPLLRRLLEADTPYGARATFSVGKSTSGWNAPPTSAWLRKSVDRASSTHFGQPAMYKGSGGTIRVIELLAKEFPTAQYLITGVLGPGSNAHGPNEFLHVPTAIKLTAAVAEVIADHCIRVRP